MPDSTTRPWTRYCQLTLPRLLHSRHHEPRQFKKHQKQNKSKNNLGGSQTELVLNVLFWNVQGIGNKIDVIEHFVHTNDVNVLCIAEHWLNKDEMKMLNTNNFSHINSFCRSNMSKGGCAIFTKYIDNVKTLENVNKLSSEHVCEISTAYFFITKVGLHLYLQTKQKIS